jgi:hypothetical protein
MAGAYGTVCRVVIRAIKRHTQTIDGPAPGLPDESSNVPERAVNDRAGDEVACPDFCHTCIRSTVVVCVYRHQRHRQTVVANRRRSLAVAHFEVHQYADHIAATVFCVYFKTVQTDRQCAGCDRVVRVAAADLEHVRVAARRTVRVQTYIVIEGERAVAERIEEYLDRHVVRRTYLVDSEIYRHRSFADRISRCRAVIAAERIERCYRDRRIYVVIHLDVLGVLPESARCYRRLQVRVRPVACRVGQAVAGRRFAGTLPVRCSSRHCRGRSTLRRWGAPIPTHAHSPGWLSQSSSRPTMIGSHSVRHTRTS